MPVKRLREFLHTAEEIIEDLIVVLLSIFLIILSICALSVLATQIPADVSERAQVIAQLLPQLNFLAKAEYFASLVLPWVIMIIGLLVIRELWLMRRTLERMHLEKILERIERLEKPKKKARKR
jgi:purine-cytosine permease-like protein